MNRQLVGIVNPEAMMLDGFDDALIGVVLGYERDPIALYSLEAVIENLSKDMDQEDAREFFDFNITGAWVGHGTPAFLDQGEEGWFISRFGGDDRRLAGEIRPTGDMRVVVASVCHME